MSKLLLLILISFTLFGCINDAKPKLDLDAIEKNVEKRLMMKNDSLSREEKNIYNKYEYVFSNLEFIDQLNDDELKSILDWFNQLPKDIEKQLSNQKLIVEIISQIHEETLNDVNTDLHQKYLNQLVKIIHSRIGYVDDLPLVPICLRTIPNNQNDSIIIKLKINKLMY